MLFYKTALSDAMRHVSCGKLISTGEFTHPDRTIDTHLLLVGVKNTLYFKEGDDELALAQDEALLLRPHFRQCSYQPSNDLIYYWTHFYLGEEFELLSYEEAIETYYFMSNRVYEEKTVLIPRHTRLLYPSRISLLFQQLFFSRYGNCYTRQYGHNCIQMLLMELTQQAMELYHMEFAQMDRGYKFTEIAQWIQINLAQRLGVKQIAERFGYTPNYLSDLFKSKTGYPLVRYINRLRMEKAKELLLTSALNIGQIARETGFEDSKYFYRIFKQYMGVSPTQLRNAWTDTHLNNR